MVRCHTDRLEKSKVDDDVRHVAPARTDDRWCVNCPRRRLWPGVLEMWHLGQGRFVRICRLLVHVLLLPRPVWPTVRIQLLHQEGEGEAQLINWTVNILRLRCFVPGGIHYL